MHDALPDPDGHRWPAHGVLYTYGVALVDNSLLEPLAQACAEERRYEFMFVALPLRINRERAVPEPDRTLRRRATAQSPSWARAAGTNRRRCPSSERQQHPDRC